MTLGFFGPVFGQLKRIKKIADSKTSMESKKRENRSN
jgi:hypothetical protein